MSSILNEKDKDLGKRQTFGRVLGTKTFKRRGSCCLTEIYDNLADKNLELKSRDLQKYLQRDLTSISYEKIMIFLFV